MHAVVHFWLAAALANLAAAIPSPQFGPLTGDEDKINLRPRGKGCLEPCQKVRNIVDLLKLQQATPFCQSFLDIETSTVETSTTVYPQTTITITNTLSATTTLTVQTDTITQTETTTVATLPTVVETITVQSGVLLTSTVTPASVTITTTVYTTPGAAPVRRDDTSEDIEERGINIPDFIEEFGSSAISRACSCLSVPTPVTTVTATITEATTHNADVVVTVVDIISTTAVTVTTKTESVTVYSPTTAYVTSVSTSSTTVTVATPTYTHVITKPYNSHCVNVLSGGKIFVNVRENRQFAYPLATTPVPGSGDEQTFSACCQLCYETPDCGFYYAYPPRPGQWACQVIYSYTQVNQNVSPTCPNGILPGATFWNPVHAWSSSQPRGIGPCYVLEAELP